MNLLDILAETFRSLSANKARSALTILGIVVGIASVIGLVSVGQGTKTTIEDQIKSAGTNLITVSNTAQSGDGLTQDDADALKTLFGVSTVEAVRSSAFDVVHGDKSTNSQIMGVSSGYADVRNINIDYGSFITNYQNDNAMHIAVVSPGLVTTVYGNGVSNAEVLGSDLRIGGVDFKVTGIIKSSTGALQQSTNDTTIYIPEKTARKFLIGNGSFSSLLVVGKDESLMDMVRTQVEFTLKSRHGYDSTGDESDFSVMSMSGLLEVADSVTGMLTALLAAIASISLVVGGIGIMNMMLTTVSERTREIGLRKAIGATPGNITLQFLVESVILTLLGGLIGVLLGMLAAYAINATGVLSTTVTMEPILLAVGVCMLIGIVFGWWPARRAAKQNPIEALRYQ